MTTHLPQIVLPPCNTPQIVIHVPPSTCPLTINVTLDLSQFAHLFKQNGDVDAQENQTLEIKAPEPPRTTSYTQLALEATPPTITVDTPGVREASGLIGGSLCVAQSSYMANNPIAAQTLPPPSSASEPATHSSTVRHTNQPRARSVRKRRGQYSGKSVIIGSPAPLHKR